MSIKRSREVSRRRPSDGGSFESSKKKDERVYTWDDDVAPRVGEPFFAYAASHKYAKDSLLEHSVFGKGIITKVEGTKIEVLFQPGPKKLVHNPAGSEAPKAQAAAPEPAAAPAPAPEPAPAPAAEPAAAAPEKP